MALKKNDRRAIRSLIACLKNRSFQRIAIGILTIAAAFLIIENGAVPKRYKLNLWDKSPYDITAPRDVENRVMTEKKAREAFDAVPPVIIRLENVPIDILNAADDFFYRVDYQRRALEVKKIAINNEDPEYEAKVEKENLLSAARLEKELESFDLPLSGEQLKYLVSKVKEEELALLKKSTREIIGNMMKEEITEENLASRVSAAQNYYRGIAAEQELKNIGGYLIKAIMKPNSMIDAEMTETRREEAYHNARENRVIIPEGARIVSIGDTITEDRLKVLEELSLLETGRFDFVFAAGILIVLILLASLLILYMRFFCRKILNSRDDIILLSVIVLLTLGAARAVHVFSALFIPIFLAAMLISILLDLKLAIMMNFILTIALSFVTKADMGFLYMAMISGTFSAFVASKANQRSKLSAAGVLVACINILIIASVSIINKSGIMTIAENSLIVFINGIVSTVLTIGILPFLESTFNIITPLKLLELANPNQMLIKRLLIEAPGTYHHSLMVGNLAEVAAEAIGGNSLLARIGAYYHDIGKLKRPNFFIENQLSDNPHDRMTPNLSTLVITSHTGDGAELAEKYKLPLAIRDIIIQHHGDTLVAYFYHKAKKSEKGEITKQEDFRYAGPKPSTKEAAVVMLADSVEAAVRSMEEKTEGKIEGLVRKIIKDKLDDGQLDMCDLTLKDLDEIAKGFMRVFSGFFHQREEYPEMKKKLIELENIK